MLAHIFALTERHATVLGTRPRRAAGGAAEQAYDLGAGVGAAATLRRVCRAWRRVHDTRVLYLRPRALDAAALPSAFPALQRLDLSRVAFPPLPQLAALLPRLRALSSLTMRDNGAGHLAAATLASALRHPACRIATLNLNENHVDDRGAASLAAALSVNRTLTELNLRDNGVTDAGATALAGALCARGGALAALDLSCNTAVGPDAAAALADALTAAPAPPLRALCLGGCGLRCAGARVLGDALPRCASLLVLSLYANGIGDAGAAALAQGLARNRTLAQLSLFGNAVGDAGAAALARALCANAALTSLDLFDNDVGAAGAAALASALAPGGGASAALREVRLCLRPPRFDADAAQALADAAGPRLVTDGVCGRRRPAPAPGGAGGDAGAWRPHEGGWLVEDSALALH